MENMLKINKMVEARKLKLFYHNKYDTENRRYDSDSVFYFHENKYINHILHAYATIDVLNAALLIYREVTGEFVKDSVIRLFNYLF